MTLINGILIEKALETLKQTNEPEACIHGARQLLEHFIELNVKQGNRLEITKAPFECELCPASYVAKANFAAHLKQDHCLSEEEIYVAVANAELYFESGLAELQALLNEYTDYNIGSGYQQTTPEAGNS